MAALNTRVFYFNSPDDYNSELLNNLDELGVKSGISQNLNGPITSLEKLRDEKKNVDVVLIVAFEGNKTLGFLKYGFKNLFFYNKQGEIKNYPNCLSLLDFYVDEKVQRRGIGRLMFEEFIKVTSTQPAAIAYDRPSPLLYSFLASNYRLKNLDLQPNRYAISAPSGLVGFLS